MIHQERRTQSQESAARFIPEDHPELWQRFLTKITQGQGSLFELNHYPGKDELSEVKREVVDMFIPRAIQPPEGLDNVKLNWLLRSLSINASGENMSLELEGYIDKEASDKPCILEILDYNADLPTPGGTQIFYKNLQRQLARMGTPVMYGQKVPTSLSFFMHRVGQVPVSLLDNRFQDIQARIYKKFKRTPEEMRKLFSQFSFTVNIYGVEQLDMLAPEHREPFQRMQQAFNEMSREDRVGKYNTLLCDTFSLSAPH